MESTHKSTLVDFVFYSVDSMWKARSGSDPCEHTLQFRLLSGAHLVLNLLLHLPMSPEGLWCRISSADKVEQLE